jgi:hypothetical protein
MRSSVASLPRLRTPLVWARPSRSNPKHRPAGSAQCSGVISSPEGVSQPQPLISSCSFQAPVKRRLCRKTRYCCLSLERRETNFVSLWERESCSGAAVATSAQQRGMASVTGAIRLRIFRGSTGCLALVGELGFAFAGRGSRHIAISCRARVDGPHHDRDEDDHSKGSD